MASERWPQSNTGHCTLYSRNGHPFASFTDGFYISNSQITSGSEPLVVSASKVYSGLGADIVYGIITLKSSAWILSKITWLRHLVSRLKLSSCATWNP